jgi:hypothetical protein
VERLDISQIEREAAEGQEVEPVGGAQLTSPLPLDMLLAQTDTAGKDRGLKTVNTVQLLLLYSLILTFFNVLKFLIRSRSRIIFSLWS